jgi:hypothetical protein
MSGDAFTRDKLRWLDQLLADQGVSDGAFRLGYLLASRYINRRTRDSFCGQERLATDLDITARAVRKLLDQLVLRGHLLIAKTRGRGHINRCRWNLKNRNDSSSFNDENRNERSSFSDRKTGTKTTVKQEQPFRKTGTKVPGNPFEESLRANPFERRRDADSDKKVGKTTKGRSNSVNGASVVASLVETDVERVRRWWAMVGDWVQNDEAGWIFREWGPPPGDDKCQIPDSVLMEWFISLESPRTPWHVMNALRVLEQNYLSVCKAEDREARA